MVDKHLCELCDEPADYLAVAYFTTKQVCNTCYLNHLFAWIPKSY